MKNKYLFFLIRLWRDFTNPLKFEIANDLHSAILGDYYFIFDEDKMQNQKGAVKSFKLDENGIPMNPTYIDVSEQDYVYFPITIGQYGLSVFQTYLKTKSEHDKNRFLNIADWFYKNRIDDKKSGAYWLTHVPLPQYQNQGPWQSAFVQSRGISVLLRAYQLTGNEKFVTIAEQALTPYTKPVSDGGVTSFTEWGPFYEEYTAAVPTLVLNGMVFSLCGVHDFIRVFPENELARQLFDQGIQTLINILPVFDLTYWSRYNLCRADWYPAVDPATVNYQRLHIVQLNMLYRLTNNEIFNQYAKKFKSQDNIFNVLRMYITKYRALKKLNRL